jgi:hypothetical protein
MVKSAPAGLRQLISEGPVLSASAAREAPRGARDASYLGGGVKKDIDPVTERVHAVFRDWCDEFREPDGR